MQQQDNHEYPFLYQRQTCHQVQPNQATYQKRQRSEERFSRNAETDLVCRLLLEKKYNPTIFDHAIKNSSAYDAAIRQKLREGKSGEDLFLELALEHL